MEKEDEGIGVPSDPYDEALEEYAKNVIVDPNTVMGDYVKMMVTLNSALITTYFALLKFLGIEKTADITIDKFYLVEPTIFLLVSLAAFIVASFPIPRRLAIGNPDSIKNHRRFGLIWKFTGISIGSVFFWLGIAVMISVLITVIE
jgi:hypothetical protein